MGNRLNERVMADFLHLYAVGGTRDDLRSAYEDLMREGLLDIVVVDDIHLLSLTLSGAELVERKTTNETVYRPGPGERY
jgi:3'-phosphoadenosine 5'-phosphosulfate sulfotransferase